MAKLLQLALLYAFSIQTCFAAAASNPNDQQPGSNGEREEALIEQQIQATTEELRIANYPQMRSLCLVCFVQGLSKNNLDFIAEAEKNRKHPNSGEFAMLSEMVLADASRTLYKGKGVPDDGIDDVCSPLVFTVLEGLLEELNAGNIEEPNEFIADQSKEVRMMAISRFRNSYWDDNEDPTFSCRGIISEKSL